MSNIKGKGFLSWLIDILVYVLRPWILANGDRPTDHPDWLHPLFPSSFLLRGEFYWPGSGNVCYVGKYAPNWIFKLLVFVDAQRASYLLAIYRRFILGWSPYTSIELNRKNNISYNYMEYLLDNDQSDKAN